MVMMGVAMIAMRVRTRDVAAAMQRGLLRMVPMAMLIVVVFRLVLVIVLMAMVAVVVAMAGLVFVGVVALLVAFSVAIAVVVMAARAGRRPGRMGMAVVMVVRAGQPQGADDVDRQTDGRDPQGLAVMDADRREQTLRQLHRHQHAHHAQQQRAGEAAEDLDLPGAEGEARVFTQAARDHVGHQRDAQRQHVRAHVPAVGQ